MGGVGPLLALAVEDVRADSYLAERIIGRARRRRGRRRVAVGVVATVSAAVFGITLVPDQRGADSIDSVTAAPTVTSEPAVIAGPKGLPGALLLDGPAYPVGSVEVRGRRLAEVVFVAHRRGGAEGFPWLCTARLQPGAALVTARVDACTGPAWGDPAGLVRGSGPEPAPVGLLVDPTYRGDQILTLRGDVARAELLLAHSSDVGFVTGHAQPRVRRRIAVRLLGGDQPNMPVLIGTAPAPPPGYVVVGTNAWNSAGEQILHELAGS